MTLKRISISVDEFDDLINRLVAHYPIQAPLTLAQREVYLEQCSRFDSQVVRRVMRAIPNTMTQRFPNAGELREALLSEQAAWDAEHAPLPIAPRPRSHPNEGMPTVQMAQQVKDPKIRDRMMSIARHLEKHPGQLADALEQTFFPEGFDPRRKQPL